MSFRPHTLTLNIVALLALLGAGAATANVTFIGEGSLPGNAVDQSGLTGLLEDGVTPHNLAGGLGSAMTYLGGGNFYVATPDRGPADGATSYIDRLYTLRIDLDKLGPDSYRVSPSIVDTRLLRRDPKSFYTGNATAFDATNSPDSLRFDPEGVRVSACGRTVFVSDEYGPFIHELSRFSGKRLRSIPIPNKFLIDFPSATPSVELTNNLSGRQSNRGMEGLAISPDGGKLYGIMQSPLIQDGGLDAANKRVGTNGRIVEVDVHTGATRELLYPLDDKGNGVSEILAVNDHEFLVIERDGKAGAAAAFKKIFRIDIAVASDIRGVKQLPQTGIPAGVTPVAKQLFIDALDPAFGLAGATFPEKLEALAFGPDLEDGRHLLLVVNDNDFIATEPTRFLAFAIDGVDLPAFAPQRIGAGWNPACRSNDADE